MGATQSQNSEHRRSTTGSAVARRGSFCFGAGLNSSSPSTEIARELFGAKAAGLVNLPGSWVPPFTGISTKLYRLWKNQKRTPIRDLLATCGIGWSDFEKTLGAHDSKKFIVRSSAIGEGLDDRGQFASRVADSALGIKGIESAIEHVFLQFEQKTQDRELAIIVQRFVSAEIAGHLSNEVRLSPTRNQWKFEIEHPTLSSPKGLNSKFARLPVTNTQLALPRGGLNRCLRELAAWVNSNTDRRSHLEWLVNSRTLWVLQWDVEAITSTGVDPRVMPSILVATSTHDNHLSYFKKYAVGSNVPWLKLKNIDDFQTKNECTQHSLFFSDGARIENIGANSTGLAELGSEITHLTNDSAVVRIDSIAKSQQSLNLPRTNTVTGGGAARWILERAAEFKRTAISPNEYCFIVHRFIPARAAAWSYYQNGTNLVEIDALWGLPDGLQFLPHDSFQLDKNGRVISEKIRFKSQFLQEQIDGVWKYVPIARQFGRCRVLSNSALEHLAKETVAIALRLRADAQIMWFCDIPAELGMGQHLPWYRAREFADRAAIAPRPFPTIVVTRRSDLIRVQQDARRQIIIRISPEADLVRDETFLDEIIKIALDRGIPVELAGSILGHAYYRLRKAGITVVTSEPYAAYYRTRGRKVFRKLVRDQIPDRIAFGGESVIQATLTGRQVELGLVSKLFEEAQEFLVSKRLVDRTEELSDIYEVIRGIAFNCGLPWDDIEKTANTKRDKRGGFEGRTLLVETSYPMPATDMSASLDSGEISIDQSDPLIVGEAHASVPLVRLLTEGKNLSIAVPYKGIVITISMDLQGSQLQIIVKAVDGQPKDEIGDRKTLQLNLFKR